jgi:3-oxoacyl-[acyl-carrier-protein] synthase II
MTPPSPRRVAITGVGVVAPNGIGREAFWRALAEGRSGVRRIAAFPTDGLSTQIAGEIADFDAAAHVPAKDREHVPRAVPLALAAAREALADAGLDPAAMDVEARRRFGVVLGAGAGAVEFLERQYALFFAGKTRKASVYAVPSATTGTLSSELSMAFGLRGPSHVLSTGCTSSTDALGYARMQIRHGGADVLLAGGVDAPLTPGILAGFCLMRVTTPSWNHDPARGSRPFSAGRDGFVPGEGAWLFVLEPLDRARARGARVYAELAGYGATCDAHHRVRLDESGEEPARAMTLALEDAGLPPEAVDHVTLHGTSTVLNDRIETRAVRRALGGRADRIPMSAPKSMIGHPQGAAGAAGVAAALLAIERGVVAPTINLDRPDPACDLDYVPNAARKAGVHVALCNCIGFGSKNAALVLRRAHN